MTPPQKSASKKPIPLINRELSWLAFNNRVLEEAQDAQNPILERLRFLTIFHTNLDEFFMIRVSGIKQQINAGVDTLSADGLTARSQLHHVLDRVQVALQVATHTLQHDILPALHAQNVCLRPYSSLNDSELLHCSDWYERHIHPVLTPLATGSTQPFPFISNLSLNLGMFVRSNDGEERFARVKIPDILSRLVPLNSNSDHYVLLEEVVAAHAHLLFPGLTVDTPWPFRVIRDADIEIKEDEASDLLLTIEEELRKRRFGQAVILQVQNGIPDRIRDFLSDGLDLHSEDVVAFEGHLDPSGFSKLIEVDRPDLKFHGFVGAIPSQITPHKLFASIRKGDILLHHPFQSFTPVVDFIRQAAKDPKVYAIKQTLYRTSGDSSVIEALEAAVENGKQVAAIVELKARFDEENNITWARRLEQAGVHVIYGVPGLKTHCKMALVIRREGNSLRRYCHIGTGNYNPSTARVYTDLGLLTANPEITADCAELFNRLTGFARPDSYRRLLVAPHYMKDQLLTLIQRETQNALEGRPARIIAKCNALTDAKVISALYSASQANVTVELIVRGICSLIPGIKGLSEHITVRSVIGRFLEHSRIYWFQNDEAPEVFIGSADWMVRNLEARVEVLTPILDPHLAHQIRHEILESYLIDTERTRVMNEDGSYSRVRSKQKGAMDVHAHLMKKYHSGQS